MDLYGVPGGAQKQLVLVSVSLKGTERQCQGQVRGALFTVRSRKTY